MEGKKSGAVRTVPALLNSLIQPDNGVQAQLGAFAWSFTNPKDPSAGIDVCNQITFYSLDYHLPALMGAPTGFSSGPMSTITQNIHESFP